MSENSGERPAIMDLIERRLERALSMGSVEVIVIRSEDAAEIVAHLGKEEDHRGYLDVGGYRVLAVDPGECWVFGYAEAKEDDPIADALANTPRSD